jgi:hypothetical protein
MGTHTVFYSWQSDLPNNTNRGFIQRALERAAENIKADDTIQIEPVLDRDTDGVPGSPDIAETIFGKIDNCDVFVCDVSIINPGASRSTPNPNVLIELGYARKCLGSGRIVMVMNTEFGGPELLPFDLRPKRVTQYHARPDQDDRALARRALEASLEGHLRAIMLTLPAQPGETGGLQQLGLQVCASLEEARPNQSLLMSRFVRNVWDDLDNLAPDFPGNPGDENDEILVDCIGKTEPIVNEFIRVSEAVAAMNAVEPGHVLYRGFGHALEQQEPPRGFSGTYYPTRREFYRFIGHELFTSLTACLLRYNRWELLQDLLDQEIFADNTRFGEGTYHSFCRLSRGLDLLQRRNSRLNLRRVSVHADLLRDRRTKEDIARIVSFEEFIAADYFLYLREGLNWGAWSVIYINSRVQVPRYLAEAASVRNAEKLLGPLKVDSIEALRSLAAERSRGIRRLFPLSDPFFALESFRPDSIGTR